MKQKSFLNNLSVGIISILVAGLFGGLWFNENHKSQVLNNYLDNPFFGQFNKNAQADHDFYATVYLLACVVFLGFGVYVMVQAAKRKNYK